MKKITLVTASGADDSSGHVFRRGYTDIPVAMAVVSALRAIGYMVRTDDIDVDV